MSNDQPANDTGRPPVDAAAAASPPPPPPSYVPMGYAQPPAKRNIFGKVLTSLFTTVLIFSIAMNIWLGSIVNSIMAGPSEAVYAEGDAARRVVILPIEGIIDESTYAFVRQSLKALRDDVPAALVLRVDSGGGYVSPSDRVWHEIVKFKNDTGVPIIASFGGTAASGGYYVAAPADLIVAEPTTTTGSIGVIAPAFTVDQLLEKIGVTPEVVASTASTRKDMLSPLRAWTEEDRQKLRTILDSAHEQFVQVVLQGRGDSLSEEQVRELSTGEVFTAQVALERGLVDEVGYMERAIALAAERAGLDAANPPHVTLMRRPQTFGLMGMLSSDAPSPMSNLAAEQVRSWVLEASAPRLMYWAH